MRKLISTGFELEEKYGYSRAVVEGNWVFVSGTTGMNYATNEMPADLGEQTRNCIRNIEWALKEANSDLEHIVRLETFLVEGVDAMPCFDVLCDGVQWSDMRWSAVMWGGVWCCGWTLLERFQRPGPR